LGRDRKQWGRVAVMWRLKQGNQDITTKFLEAVTQQHQQAVRITFLNAFLNPVSDEGQLDSCFCSDPNKDVTNFVSDGNVDVDVDRLIRRTAELTILNPTGMFTPRRAKDIDTDEDGIADDPSLVGYVYLNRLVKIERGVHIADDFHMYAPVGIFMIDIAEIIAERNMTVVNLTLSDLAKRIAKSVFTDSKTYNGNDTPVKYNKIIRDILEDSGINDRLIGSIDPLNDRPESETQIDKKLTFERGQSRGEKLKELCDKWDIDIYFNPVGKLVTVDRRSNKPLPKNSVFTFSTNNPEPGVGSIVSIRRSLSDDNMFNHLIVVGTKNDKSPITYQLRNNTSGSKTSIQRIGDRAKYIESQRIGSAEQAETFAKKHWKRRLSLEETVSIDCICVPNLEGNDVITIVDSTFTNLNDKNAAPGKTYRIKRFNVPLVTSKQTFEVMDTTSLDEI
jgi:hypothetical protein